MTYLSSNLFENNITTIMEHEFYNFFSSKEVYVVALNSPGFQFPIHFVLNVNVNQTQWGILNTISFTEITKKYMLDFILFYYYNRLVLSRPLNGK